MSTTTVRVQPQMVLCMIPRKTGGARWWVSVIGRSVLFLSMKQIWALLPFYMQDTIHFHLFWSDASKIYRSKKKMTIFFTQCSIIIKTTVFMDNIHWCFHKNQNILYDLNVHVLKHWWKSNLQSKCFTHSKVMQNYRNLITAELLRCPQRTKTWSR